jgi:hypothetical protein
MLQGCVADAIDVDVLCVDASDCAMPSLPWWFSTVEEMPNAEDEEKSRKHRRIKCRHRVRKIKAEERFFQLEVATSKMMQMANVLGNGREKK